MPRVLPGVWRLLGQLRLLQRGIIGAGRSWHRRRRLSPVTALPQPAGAGKAPGVLLTAAPHQDARAAPHAIYIVGAGDILPPYASPGKECVQRSRKVAKRVAQRSQRRPYRHRERRRADVRARAGSKRLHGRGTGSQGPGHGGEGHSAVRLRLPAMRPRAGPRAGALLRGGAQLPRRDQARPDAASPGTASDRHPLPGVDRGRRRGPGAGPPGTAGHAQRCRPGTPCPAARVRARPGWRGRGDSSGCRGPAEAAARDRPRGCRPDSGHDRPVGCHAAGGAVGRPPAPGRSLGAVRRRHPGQSAPRGHVGTSRQKRDRARQVPRIRVGHGTLVVTKGGCSWPMSCGARTPHVGGPSNGASRGARPCTAARPAARPPAVSGSAWPRPSGSAPGGLAPIPPFLTNTPAPPGQPCSGLAIMLLTRQHPSRVRPPAPRPRSSRNS